MAVFQVFALVGEWPINVTFNMLLPEKSELKLDSTPNFASPERRNECQISQRPRFHLYIPRPCLYVCYIVGVSNAPAESRFGREYEFRGQFSVFIFISNPKLRLEPTALENHYQIPGWPDVPVNSRRESGIFDLLRSNENVLTFVL